MGGKVDKARKLFSTQLTRTLRHAVGQRIAKEFPRIGGQRIQMMCADMILEVVMSHLKPREKMFHGQILWYAVSKDSPPSRRRAILESDMVPVVLDLSHPDDVEALLNKKPASKRLLLRCLRLCQQAFEQGGLLSNCDLQLLLHANNSQIASLLRQWEDEHECVVPRRATLHDVGTGVTHKRIICRKRYLEGKNPREVARETYHTLDAVDRYLGQYDRVRNCRMQGMNKAETAYTLSCSMNLVEEYLRIDDELTRIHVEKPIPRRSS